MMMTVFSLMKENVLNALLISALIMTAEVLL